MSAFLLLQLILYLFLRQSDRKLTTSIASTILYPIIGFDRMVGYASGIIIKPDNMRLTYNIYCAGSISCPESYLKFKTKTAVRRRSRVYRSCRTEKTYMRQLHFPDSFILTIKIGIFTDNLYVRCRKSCAAIKIYHTTTAGAAGYRS